MKMSRIEKLFVNSKRHAKGNIKLLDRLFASLDLSTTKRVLEIGCGAGIVADHLSKTYRMNITGTDVDPEQIEVANRYYGDNEHLQFMQGDATQLPFENEAFDMVVSLKVMHHISDWEKAFEEVSRVLKPKGYFVLADLVFPKILTRILRPVVKKYGVYTIGDIISTCSKNDLCILRKEKPSKVVVMKHLNILFQKM